jgi:HEAT repeat protein
MTTDGAGEFEALVRLMPPPNEPRDPGDADRWPQIELRLGRRLPSDYKAFVATYGSGRIGEFLNVANPFSDNPHMRDLPDEMLKAYREIRTFEHIPFPIHPEPGGLIPWGDTDNGDVLFWVADPPDDPDRWSIAVGEVRGPGWFRHPGPFVRFLRDWMTGAAVIPFMGDLTSATFEPATPWAEVEARMAADRATWQSVSPTPTPAPRDFGPGHPDWPPTTAEGWVDAVRRGTFPARDVAADHLAGLDDSVLPALIELLDDIWTANWGVRAIGGHGAAAVPGLLALLDQREGRLDWFLAQALGGTRDDRVFAPLVEALTSDDPKTRQSAATGLGVLGRVEAIEPLVEALNDTHPLGRRDALVALSEVGVVGDEDTVAAVKALLADPHDLVRAAAARTYGRLGGPAAIPLLTEFLADGDAGVRVAAIDGLGATGSPEAATILLDRMPTLDPRMPVREELGATITALGRLGDERARPLLTAILDADYRDWEPAAGQATYGALARAALAALDQPSEPGGAGDPDYHHR